MLRQQIAKPVGADQIRLRFAGTVIRLFKTERAELQLGQEGAVTVKVHEVVGIARFLGFAEHRLHLWQGGRTAEVEADISLERIKRREERPCGEARINEPGVTGPTDDIEHPQRELHFARHE